MTRKMYEKSRAILLKKLQKAQDKYGRLVDQTDAAWNVVTNMQLDITYLFDDYLEATLLQENKAAKK